MRKGDPLNLELLLVGTVHTDISGPARLDKVLRYFRPQYVSVEIDKKRVDKIDRCRSDPEKALAKIFKKYPKANLETVGMCLNVYGFEYLVPRDYCRETGATLVFSDNISKIKKNLKTIKRRIVMLSPQEFLESVESYEESSIEISEEEIRRYALHSRDRSAEREIRELSGRVIHVGGLAHIFGTYEKGPNLYERLRDLNPTRMRLDKADSL